MDLAIRHEYGFTGELERAAQNELGISALGFWRQLNWVLDDLPLDIAVEHGPMINRLRRIRDARQGQRRW